ncbi:hypothetical protein J4459_01295 [Candidatus Woesearchaeota archaeon]|nr:hypothetical protein [Candidatus Woesearchaeota archaeon]
MKYIGITLDGMEKIAIQEIKEKTSSNPKELSKTVILFETDKNLEEIQFQSLTRLLKYFSHKVGQLPEYDFSDLEEPIAINCKRIGEHDFKSTNIVEQIYKKINKKVDLKEPKCVIYVYIHENMYIIGEDFLKKDLQKREYKLKTTSQSLNSLITYAAVRLSNYKEGDIILDPICKTSETLIEAGLFAKGKLIGLDPRYPNIKNSKFNAKIANIELDLYHGDLSWIQTKINEYSVDHVITILLLRNFEKKVKEIFRQSEYMLKEKGNVTIITNKRVSENNNFKLVNQLEIKHGQSYFISVFEK